MDEQDSPEQGRGPGVYGDAFRDVPVTLVVSVGRARASIGTLLSLDRNAVIPLDKGIDDPVTIYAGDRIVAHGELQEVAEAPGHLAVRITEIVSADGAS
ncbi:MAG: FliM/FliN family flagellar motor switch protein [Pseudomonadota bacterium]